MVKVVHLQTHLPSSGNAAFRLHQALGKGGVQSSMLSLTSDVGANANLDHLNLKASIIARLNSKFHNRHNKKVIEKFGLFSYPVLGNDVSKHQFVVEADIIYVHWVLAGFLNFSGLEELMKLGKPIIFFMHDMWTITGGCHHSFTCTKFSETCSSCQMFENAKTNGLPAKELKKKYQLYSKYDNLNFVSPSRWLYELAKNSVLTKEKPIFHIPNLVDATIFKPSDKKAARQILNLPRTGTLIGFGAISPKSPYKGWSYLREALELVAKKERPENIDVVIFGSDYDEEIEKALPFKCHFVGRLRDEYSAALVYNAVDLFVAPSLAETFGLVILESLRCGTPVVAFETGGIPELIDHKKNGYLAKYRDSLDLAEGISFCLTKLSKVDALPEFDTEVIVKQHLELYKQIASNKVIG
ncbi:glycosyltransferase [Maribacter sp. 2308TA10-17]|uniref:glycosyltransferase n=1 Tax=Maribacter sp. 2308TA10-17 TaxID=3386276 RepID=UPI0039BD6F63